MKYLRAFLRDGSGHDVFPNSSNQSIISGNTIVVQKDNEPGHSYMSIDFGGSSRVGGTSTGVIVPGTNSYDKIRIQKSWSGSSSDAAWKTLRYLVSGSTSGTTLKNTDSEYILYLRDESSIQSTRLAGLLTGNIGNSIGITTAYPPEILETFRNASVTIGPGFSGGINLSGLSKAKDILIQYCAGGTITMPSLCPFLETFSLTGSVTSYWISNPGYSTTFTITLPTECPSLKNMANCLRTVRNIRVFSWTAPLPRLQGLDFAFNGTTLTTFSFPQSLPELVSLLGTFGSATITGGIQFTYLPKLQNMSYCFQGSSISSISLPEQLPELQEWDSCFSGNSMLQSLTLPYMPKHVRGGGFSGCTSLTNLVCPPNYFVTPNVYILDAPNWSYLSLWNSLYTNQKGRDISIESTILLHPTVLAKLSSVEIETLRSIGLTVVDELTES
jgi:hypothetical protein